MLVYHAESDSPVYIIKHPTNSSIAFASTTMMVEYDLEDLEALITRSSNPNPFSDWTMGTYKRQYSKDIVVLLGEAEDLEGVLKLIKMHNLLEG